MAFLAAMTTSHAQESTQILVEGDIVTLGEPQGSDYQHIDFPRKNFIIKHGAIANFNALVGKKLVVEGIEMNKNGTPEAVLRRKDGLKFFRFYPTVTADVQGALVDGELKIVSRIRED